MINFTFIMNIYTINRDQLGLEVNLHANPSECTHHVDGVGKNERPLQARLVRDHDHRALLHVAALTARRRPFPTDNEPEPPQTWAGGWKGIRAPHPQQPHEHVTDALAGRPSRTLGNVGTTPARGCPLRFFFILFYNSTRQHDDKTNYTHVGIYWIL